MNLTLTRHYADGSAGGVTETAGTDGLFAAAYVRAGLLYKPDPADEIVLAATLAHGVLDSEAYSENFSTANLFAASFDGAAAEFSTAKLGAAWTHTASSGFDLTLNAAYGHIFAHDDLNAEVMFVGAVSGAADDEDFFEYGARLGFEPSPMFKADVFVQGISGTTSENLVSFGGSLRHEF